MIKKLFVTVIISIMLHFTVLSQSHRRTQTKIEIDPKVTFIELGSVKCIPCKQMQPIMKSVEEKYGTQIKVVFYDVWKEDQKRYATKYGIKLIPTQVFLDEKGKEFFRHEGFYPETEIDKLLQKKGLKPIKKKE
jgi:thioredoxin 1